MSEKIKELYIGQEFANYPAVAKWLGVKPTKGKGRDYHIKEFETYCTYKKQKNKFIVTMVKSKKETRIDNRGKHGNQVGSPRYAEYMDILILHALQKDDKKEIKTTLTSILVYNLKIMSNDYYKLKAGGIKSLSDNNDIPQYAIKKYDDMITDTIKSAFVGSLNRLQNKTQQLTYEYVHMIKFTSDDSPIKADADISKTIIKAEKDALKDMDKPTMKYLWNRQLRNEHRLLTLSKLEDLGLYIYRYWREYHIKLIDVNIEITDVKAKESLTIVKELFIMSTHDKLNKENNQKQLDKKPIEYNFDGTVKEQRLHYFYKKDKMLDFVLKIDKLLIDRYEYFVDTENENYEFYQQGYNERCVVNDKELADWGVKLDYETGEVIAI